MRCSFLNDDAAGVPCNAGWRIYIPLLGERRLFCANTGYRCESPDHQPEKVLSEGGGQSEGALKRD